MDRQRDREETERRERERETEKRREIERDRETERQRDRETERQRDRETERQRKNFMHIYSLDYCSGSTGVSQSTHAPKFPGLNTAARKKCRNEPHRRKFFITMQHAGCFYGRRLHS
jgi:hypothetical protein